MQWERRKRCKVVAAIKVVAMAMGMIMCGWGSPAHVYGQHGRMEARRDGGTEGTGPGNNTACSRAKPGMSASPKILTSDVS